MQCKLDKKIVFSGIDLVGASMSHCLEMMDKIREILEPLMIDLRYLNDAPFLWIGMVFRYGLKNEDKPHYRKIDKSDGELELAKELDMRVLLTADETDPEFLLKDFLEIATLDCLIHAGKKYKLKIHGLVERHSLLGQIPHGTLPCMIFFSYYKERYKETLPLLH